jgi:hypothetical protein
MRKKLKLISASGDSRSKKCRRGKGGVCDGFWWSVTLAGVWSEAVGADMFGINLASVAMLIFLHLIYK